MSGISKTSIIQILKEEKNFHPYHLSLYQDFHGTDFIDRMHFSQWSLQQYESDQSFFKRVLYTNEASFTNHGQLNLRNKHYWSTKNPHWLRLVEKQKF